MHALRAKHLSVKNEVTTSNNDYFFNSSLQGQIEKCTKVFKVLY